MRDRSTRHVVILGLLLLVAGPARAEGLVRIANLAYDYERHSVVLDITGPVTVATRSLPRPARLVVDMPSALFVSRNRDLAIHDRLVKRVRVSQFQIVPAVVRVVIETQGANEPMIAVQQTANKLYITVAKERPAEPSVEFVSPTEPSSGPTSGPTSGVSNGPSVKSSPGAPRSPDAPPAPTALPRTPAPGVTPAPVETLAPTSPGPVIEFQTPRPASPMPSHNWPVQGSPWFPLATPWPSSPPALVPRPLASPASPRPAWASPASILPASAMPATAGPGENDGLPGAGTSL